MITNPLYKKLVEKKIIVYRDENGSPISTTIYTQDNEAKLKLEADSIADALTKQVQAPGSETNDKDENDPSLKRTRHKLDSVHEYHRKHPNEPYKVLK
jgi:hypothetical protein